MKRLFYSLTLIAGLILALGNAFGAGPWAAAKGSGPVGPSGPAVPAALPTTPPSPIPTPAICALTFHDVQTSDYFYPAVQYLACRVIVSGYTCGGPNEPCDPNNSPYFRPGAGTTRSQLTKLVTGGMAWSPITPAVPSFADVPVSHPFYSFVETAVAHGLISGYTCGGPGEPCDGQNRPYFRPYSEVTRGQMSKIIVGAKGWATGAPATGTFADVSPGNAFFGVVEAATAHGLISGYTCGGPDEPCDGQNRPYFRPGRDATRGQLSKILYNALTGP
jgi:hypothetical protein